MPQLILIFGLIVKLFPTLIEAVRAVETEFPEGGQGAAKAALVRMWLETAFAALGAVGVTFGQVWPALEATIAQVVALYNSLGKFKKSANTSAG